MGRRHEYHPRRRDRTRRGRGAMSRVLLLAWAGCASSDAPPPSPPVSKPTPYPPVAPVVQRAPAGWVRGSTHVHAHPSGDSNEPIPSVIRWYEQRGYDFIVLTDHNK